MGFGVAVRLEYIQYPIAFGLGAGVIAMVGTNHRRRPVGPRDAHRVDRGRLCIAALAYPFLGMGLTMASAFQAGWIAVRTIGADVGGPGAVAARGLVVYGSILVIAFRVGAWKKPTS